MPRAATFTSPTKSSATARSTWSIPPASFPTLRTWDQPDLARWLLRLARFARVIMFDKRGTGLSDRVGELPSFDERMDDVRAVMDAVGLERAALLGVSEGGPLTTLFA